MVSLSLLQVNLTRRNRRLMVKHAENLWNIYSNALKKNVTFQNHSFLFLFVLQENSLNFACSRNKKKKSFQQIIESLRVPFMGSKHIFSTMCRVRLSKAFSGRTEEASRRKASKNISQVEKSRLRAATKIRQMRPNRSRVLRKKISSSSAAVEAAAAETRTVAKSNKTKYTVP